MNGGEGNRLSRTEDSARVSPRVDVWLKLQNIEDQDVSFYISAIHRADKDKQRILHIDISFIFTITPCIPRFPYSASNPMLIHLFQVIKCRLWCPQWRVLYDTIWVARIEDIDHRTRTVPIDQIVHLTALL